MTRRRATAGHDRPWNIALAVWIAVAGLGFVLAPEPPEAPAIPPGEEAIWRRTAAWAERDARTWQREKGDHRIPWEEADGHLAIVIDDVGRELHVFEKLLSLRARITFSILPGSVYAPGVQLRLRGDHRRYREIMLHLPMEPTDPGRMLMGREPREDWLRISDDPGALVSKLDAALIRVPAAVGVNNHMGSRLTEDRRAMAALMPELAKRGLYFLDSRTSAGTVAEHVALESGVPALHRRVFLDNTPTQPAIRSSLAQAVEMSRREPTIAIGHPSVELYEVLREALPDIHRSGVGIYPVSVMVAKGGSSPPPPPVEPGPAPGGEPTPGDPIPAHGGAEP